MTTYYTNSPSRFGGCYATHDPTVSQNVNPTPTPTPGRSGLGGDDVPRRNPNKGWSRAEWKKRVKDNQDAIEQTLRETYARLTGEDAPLSVLAKVDAIVAPVSKRVKDEPLQVDWARVALDYARYSAMMKLYQDEIELQAAIEEDNEIWMLLH